MLPQTLALRGDARAQADYLMHFRADSIVKDAESIRRELVGDEEPWSVLGQSYGGFCAVHVSVDPPARSARGLHHRRPAAARRQHPDDYYRAHLPGGRAQDAAILCPLSAGSRALRADHGAPASARRRAADGRPAHRPPLSAARLRARIRRRHGDASLPARGRLLPRCCRRRTESAVPARARACAVVRDESDLRRPARDVLHAGRRRELVGATRARRIPRHGLGARAAAVADRRNDLSVDVRRLSPTAPAARRRGAPGARAALAAVVRRGAARAQHGSGRRRDLRRRHVRAARAVGADRGIDRRPQGLADQRIRAQRPAQQRRRGVRAAARDAARRG